MPAQYDAMIEATGTALAGLIPLQIIRGQISLMRANDQSALIKTNLCYGGYLGPAIEGVHVLGSTFQHWLDTPEIRSEDHLYVRDRLAEAVSPVFTENDVIGGRVGFRASTPDRLPVIGLAASGQAVPTFISGAHGSHGLVTSIAAAHILADMISGAGQSQPRETLAAVAPSRFGQKQVLR